MQRGQFGAGREPQLLVEHVAGVPVDGQRVGLPAGPVEPEHEQAGQALPGRMRADRAGEVDHHLVVAPAGEVRLRAGLGRGEAQLGQVRRDALAQLVAGHVGQQRSAPEPQGAPQ